MGVKRARVTYDDEGPSVKRARKRLPSLPPSSSSVGSEDEKEEESEDEDTVMKESYVVQNT